MKIAIIGFALLFLPGAAFAQGTCPSGLPVSGTNCFFIAANGADTNSGTSESTPWVHAPGMPTCASTCASAVPAAGEGFIFRGGDTWHTANSGAADGTTNAYTGFGVDPNSTQSSSWNWDWSGSSSNCTWTWWPDSGLPAQTSSCIYIGVDKTWFSGSSWTRPSFDLDNPLSTSLVASCAFDETTAFHGIALGQFTGYPGFADGYLIFDNFNFYGHCLSGVPNPEWGYMDVITKGYVAVINSYFHGWTETFNPQANGSSPEDQAGAISFGYTDAVIPFGATHDVVAWDVFDGSDDFCRPPILETVTVSGTTITGTGFPTGLTNTMNIEGQAGGDYAAGFFKVTFTSSTSGTADGVTPTSGSYTGLINMCLGGPASEFYDFSHNVTRYLADTVGNAQNNMAHIHDNLFDHMYESFDPAAHGGVLEQNSNDLNQPMEWYNNIVRNTGIGEVLGPDPTPSSPLYFFNNVLEGGGGGAIQFASINNDTGEQAYITNNTFDNNNIRTSQNGNGTLFQGTITFENNHVIASGATSIAGWVPAQAGVTFNDPVPASEIFQTESVANGQGYVTGNDYQPTSTSGATYHAGSNLSTSCSTYSPDSSLCNGSTGGVTNTAGAGVIPTLYIASPPARGSTWDSGAYQFSGAGPTVPVVSAGPWYADLDELLFGVSLR